MAMERASFMTRSKTAPLLAVASAVGFLLAAGLHATEYRRVVLRAQQGFSGLAPLVATLWLTFAAALVILGLIVTLVAFGHANPGRSILALAGCFPAITVALQLNDQGGGEGEPQRGHQGSQPGKPLLRPQDHAPILGGVQSGREQEANGGRSREKVCGLRSRHEGRPFHCHNPSITARGNRWPVWRATMTI